MKTLDLTTYGVEEMNTQEINETEGGWSALVRWGIRVIEIIGIVDALNEIVEGVKEGYESTQTEEAK